MTEEYAGTPELLCLLSVPRSLEERLIDWLLERSGTATFASLPIDVHGSDPASLHGVEQVSGRQRRIQFQVPIEAARLDEFLEALRQEFRAANVTWFVVPVLASGTSADPAPASTPS